jgi:hypothetical protein
VFLTPDPTMPDVLRRNRDASMIPGMLGEFFVRLNGQQQYLWRAVDQDGNVIDILLRSRRDQRAAQRFLHRLLRGQGKATIPDHRRQARAMLLLVGRLNTMPTIAPRFRSSPLGSDNDKCVDSKAQRFLSLHSVVRSLFASRHLLRSTHCRLLRSRPSSSGEA